MSHKYQISFTIPIIYKLIEIFYLIFSVFRKSFTKKRVKKILCFKTSKSDRSSFFASTPFTWINFFYWNFVLFKKITNFFWLKPTLIIKISLCVAVIYIKVIWITSTRCICMSNKNYFTTFLKFRNYILI